MHRSIKIRQFILMLALLLIITRYSLIAKVFFLFFLYIQLLFTSPELALAQISFQFIDFAVSIILLAAAIIYFLMAGKKVKYFQSNLNFTSAVIILLISFFLFAPLITDNNPDFQKDLSVTKLLPPFSSVKVLHLNNDNYSTGNTVDKFINLKSRVIKNSFDDSIIFIDSISAGNKLTYYQGGAEVLLANDKVIFKNNTPLITTRTFILGTDELGRDIFTRLIYGARISLFVGLGSVLISLLLGLFLGFFAGYSEGFIDTALNRLTDMFLAFPVIFFIILIIALFGNSLPSVIMVLGFSGWMSLFKIVRSEVISLKNKDFFVSARLIGLSNIKLLLKETLPYILVPVVVNLVFQYGNVILAEAALSYLGLGTGSSYPSWGSMIEAGQNYLSQAWWMILFPGLALFLTLFAANSLGRKISSHFNPRVNS
ncbi:MAG: ABC transporter permease [Ignavibacteriaceae bacterium]|nr:ABC transporter permease [Ignavibacteriaceae bacterium]